MTLTLDQVHQAAKQMDRTAVRLRTTLQQATSALDSLRVDRDTISAQQELLGQVASYLTTFGEEAQNSTQRKIEALVTHGLRTVFGQEMEFKLVQSTRGKLATLDFVISSKMGDEMVETSVLDARGGGVASVVGFLLRLVVLLLTPTAGKLMVLDETFAQVSDEYEGRVAEFLRELVDKTPTQIVLITHSQAYGDVADNVYRFRLEAGQTKVTSNA